MTIAEFIAQGPAEALSIAPYAGAAIVFALLAAESAARYAARPFDGRLAAPLLLAGAFAAAHLQDPGNIIAPLQTGKAWLFYWALFAGLVGLLAGAGAPLALTGVLVLGGAYGSGALFAPHWLPDQVGSWWWLCSGGTILLWSVWTPLVRRADSRALVFALGPALGALGALVVIYGHEATLGKRLIGLGMGGGALLLFALARPLSLRGLPPTLALLLPAAICCEGRLPLALAALTLLAAVAPAACLLGARCPLDAGRADGRRWALGAAAGALVTVAALGGAVATQHLEPAQAAEPGQASPAEGSSGGSSEPADAPYDPYEQDSGGDEPELPY